MIFIGLSYLIRNSCPKPLFATMTGAFEVGSSMSLNLKDQDVDKVIHSFMHMIHSLIHSPAFYIPLILATSCTAAFEAALAVDLSMKASMH